MTNESIKNIITISFDFCYTDRKVVNDGLQFQVDIESAQNINIPKILVATHQTADRKNVPDKENNIEVFENLDVRK